ncbi:hypothetical protein B0H13DRAFT_1935858 [Mycena leptocephala]|nr:hypothetical protein B0H13DRAFT_1935858 [Mycena leptocephala]
MFPWQKLHTAVQWCKPDFVHPQVFHPNFILLTQPGVQGIQYSAFNTQPNVQLYITRGLRFSSSIARFPITSMDAVNKTTTLFDSYCLLKAAQNVVWIVTWCTVRPDMGLLMFPGVQSLHSTLNFGHAGRQFADFFARNLTHGGAGSGYNLSSMYSNQWVANQKNLSAVSSASISFANVDVKMDIDKIHTRAKATPWQVSWQVSDLCHEPTPTVFAPSSINNSFLSSKRAGVRRRIECNGGVDQRTGVAWIGGAVQAGQKAPSTAGGGGATWRRLAEGYKLALARVTERRNQGGTMPHGRQGMAIGSTGVGPRIVLSRGADWITISGACASRARGVVLRSVKGGNRGGDPSAPPVFTGPASVSPPSGAVERQWTSVAAAGCCSLLVTYFRPYPPITYINPPSQCACNNAERLPFSRPRLAVVSLQHACPVASFPQALKHPAALENDSPLKALFISLVFIDSWMPIYHFPERGRRFWRPNVRSEMGLNYIGKMDALLAGDLADLKSDNAVVNNYKLTSTSDGYLVCDVCFIPDGEKQ